MQFYPHVPKDAKHVLKVNENFFFEKFIMELQVKKKKTQYFEQKEILVVAV